MPMTTTNKTVRGSWREGFTVGERVEVLTSRGWQPARVAEVPRRERGTLRDTVRGELRALGDVPGQEFRLSHTRRDHVRRVAV